jgi:hypothetical protein
LHQRIPIIIRSFAFPFGILSLRSPEIHTVRFQYGREYLSIFLRLFPEESCRLGDAGGGTYSGIYVGQQTFCFAFCTSAEQEAYQDDTEEFVFHFLFSIRVIVNVLMIY